MKIYIMTDMEGVAGVLSHEGYCLPHSPYYEVGKQLTTLEVNSAIEGCLAAGATDILVVDGHGPGAIEWRLLHPRAELLIGSPIGYPFGCNSSFDAAMMVGQHAKSNTDGGHLSHSNSFAVEDEVINGISIGEAGENLLFASYFGVPTVMVSGDLACCAEVQALVPSIEAVAVKEGLRRGPATGLTAAENRRHNGAAIHLSPQVARDRIRAGAQHALEHCTEIGRFWIEPPYELAMSWRVDGDRPARTAVTHSEDLLDLLRRRS